MHPKLGFSRPVSWLSIIAAAVFFACLLPSISQAQHRALIISIDSYLDSKLGTLPSGLAKNNSAAIQKLLTEKLGYKIENIKVLQNRQATRKAIINAISSWLGPETPDAAAPARLKGLEASGVLKKKSKRKKKRVRKKLRKAPKSYNSYLYFAGFGFTKSGKGSDYMEFSLVPYDATLGSAGDRKIIEGSISSLDLQKMIARFIRRRPTLVFDTKNIPDISTEPDEVRKVEAQQELRPLAGAISGIKRVVPPDAGKLLAQMEAAKFPSKVTLWQAASPGQMSLVAGSEEKPVGLFTSAFVRAIMDADADKNANGIVSNAEVLLFVSDISAAYCKAYKERCKTGLKPQLYPVSAFGRSAWVDRKKVSRGKERRLTLTRLMDFLGAIEKSEITLTQSPPSPLKVGAGNIRYEVTSTSSGHLILLNLTNDGALFQLYPNQYAGLDGNGFAGKLAAETLLKVPEESWGVSYNATIPAKGNIIAVHVPGDVKFDASISARTISAISHGEAIRVYLAELAAALSSSTRWSVATLPYEILP